MKSRTEQRIAKFGKQVQKATTGRKQAILEEIGKALENIGKKYGVFIELTGEVKIREAEDEKSKSVD